jgi:hypothetical protein
MICKCHLTIFQCWCFSGLLEAAVVVPPSNTAIVIGSSATIYCAVKGDARDVVWTYRVPPLNTECSSIYPNSYNISCAGNTSALTVVSASSSTTPRIYTCVHSQDFAGVGARAAFVALSTRCPFFSH